MGAVRTKAYIEAKKPRSAVERSLTHPKRNLAVVAGGIVLVGTFLFLPFLSYSVPGEDQYAFLGIRANAAVSPMYLVTQCGVVYNPTISTTFGAVDSTVSLWNGPHWTCGNQWTQTSLSSLQGNQVQTTS